MHLETKVASQSRASVQKLWDEQKPIAFFGIEGGFALNSDINNIKIFRELGVMRYTLTHFESPEWANSDTNQSENGLNKLGIELVGEMNSAGIIVDVAHANETTMLDVCLASSKPIVYSHGGVQQLSQSARGVSDRAMCEIAKSGGVIGLSLFPHHHTPIIEYQTGALEAFYKDYSLLKSLASPHYNLNRAAEVKMLLSEFPAPLARPSIEFFKRTLDYIINKVGVEAVAIGTDFDGSPFYFERISDCKDLFLIANVLNSNGISAEIIDNLFWKNSKRVIWDNLNE